MGLLGGAFNPPHVGHLICAHEACEQLGLDRVLLVPMGTAPHREIAQDPGGPVRVELCEQAVAGDERLAVSPVEVERAGPSYTVDTLRLLRERSPSDDPTVILGADQAATLPSWREPEEVLALATVAVAERGGLDEAAMRERLAGLAGSERIVFFAMPRLDVSSSLVRERAASGRSIRYLVPDKVAAYVGARGLYEASTPVSAE